jgi:hypothetical protein
MSYILVRAGKAPFVLTVDNAKAYFDPSTLRILDEMYPDRHAFSFQQEAPNKPGYPT